ncbi:Src substrate cortactin [Galemys pyrenaicus]|uniref:Src substrate cortactin n=1 Tax=Galemys pyrenaicus TaxID=202257 RepID=A0A8J6DGU9_GALPY|nr:Src substrate cortactin [Galemys pyrenaicus]
MTGIRSDLEEQTEKQQQRKRRRQFQALKEGGKPPAATLRGEREKLGLGPCCDTDWKKHQRPWGLVSQRAVCWWHKPTTHKSCDTGCSLEHRLCRSVVVIAPGQCCLELQKTVPVEAANSKASNIWANFENLAKGKEQEDERKAPDDIITNMEMTKEGWWPRLCKGSCRLFPANYVELRQ